MTASDARLIQAPQLRATDGQKASLRLGDRIPYATGSFQPGVGSVGVSPLVSTQFNYADVGVNVDMTPKIHSEKEVTLALEIEISNQGGSVNIGGIDQPIIVQRRLAHSIRIREGETTFIGGLMKDSDTRTTAGIPFLSTLPFVGNFFSPEQDRTWKERNGCWRWCRTSCAPPNTIRKICEPSIPARTRHSRSVTRRERRPAQPLRSRSRRRPPLPPAGPRPPRRARHRGPAAATEPATEPAPPAAEEAKPAPPAAQLTGLGFTPPVDTAKLNGEVSIQFVVRNVTDLFTAPMKISLRPEDSEICSPCSRGPSWEGTASR